MKKAVKPKAEEGKTYRAQQAWHGQFSPVVGIYNMREPRQEYYILNKSFQETGHGCGRCAH